MRFHPPFDGLLSRPLRAVLLRDRRLACAVVLLAALLASEAGPSVAQEVPLFTRTIGFANKTGFRGVFAWQARQPVNGIVHYGTNPAFLDQTAAPVPGVADTAQIAIAELVTGSTYYYQIEDAITGERSAIGSFRAANAYNAWNGAVYTLDLLIQLDTDSLPPEIPSDQALTDIAAGINVFAERVYDALDGYARIGRVLITDTNLEYAANVPFQSVPLCPLPEANLADVLIQTTVPFDSHTFGGWAVDDPCTAFYVGRIGQLVVPWEDDLHFGYVSTHEMMHYAFNAPDLYPEGTVDSGVTADCRNLAWDGSVMHNTGGFAGKWELTELDRNPTLTPCEHGDFPWTWDALRERYTEVPLNPEGPIDDMFNDRARGNPDGGALEIIILDRQPGASTLTPFTPEDQVPTCGNDLPQVTDPADDATGLHVVGQTPLPSEPSLDVTGGFLTWEPATEAVTFHIQVNDLQETPPLAATGHFFRFFFTYDNARYQVTAGRDALGESRGLRTGDNTTLASGLSGSFDDEADEITIVLTADQFAASVPAAPRFAELALLDGFEILGQRYEVALTLTADTARGTCSYRIGQEKLAPNQPPVAGEDAATTSEDLAVQVAVLANDSDPDGDVVVLQSAGNSQAGALVTKQAGGTVRYQPTADFSGTDSFTYTVSDGKGGSDSALVIVTVTPAPDSPVAVNDAAGTAAGVPVTIAVLANDSDPDGEALTVISATQGSVGHVTNNGSSLTYSPGGGFVEGDSFTYTVGDGTGRTSTATVSVQRSDCVASFFDDLEPAPEPGWTFNNQNGPLAGTTWAAVPDPMAVSPARSFFSDATDLSASKDDRMVAPPQRIGLATRLRFWHRFRTENRFDGGVLEISTNGGAAWTDVVAAGGFFEAGGYTGTANALNGRMAWEGASPSSMTQVVVNLGALAGRTVLVRWRLVTDANLGDAGWWVDDVRFTDTMGENCTSPNRDPVANDDEAFTGSGTAVTVSVLANDSDPDGDPLSVEAVGEAPSGSVVSNGTSVNYTPDPGFAGTDAFTYSAGDGFGGSDVATVLVHVNDPPDAHDDEASTSEDQAVTIDVTVNDSDSNGDSLRVSSATTGGHGSTHVNGDGTVSYVPAPDFNGADAFSYTISDGMGGSDSASVAVTVTSVNDAPQAEADSATTQEGSAIDIAVLANDSDVDGDSLTIVSVSRPESRATARIRPDGTIRYKPRPHFTGTDVFSYTINDAVGGVSTATVTVTVVP